MGEFSALPRESAVAGRFYPGDARDLREQVESFLVPAPEDGADVDRGKVLAALVPHAGYVFSGAIAGTVLGRITVPNRVVLLGPNHTGRGKVFSLWSGGAWQTPLGDALIDEEARAFLATSGAGFAPDRNAHLQEHSLEVVVPFIQCVNPAARITPITIGGAPFPALERAGNALADLVLDARAKGEGVLLLVSSDMSHFLPHDVTEKVDNIALNALETLDPETFCNTVRGNDITMCGVFPMTMALYALKRLGVAKARRIAYATSGQTGKAFGADTRRVVGYAGLAFTGE